MDRTDFTSAYQQREVYFLDPSMRYLVPDLRWTYKRQDNVGMSLMSLLAAGPRESLSSGVVSAMPPDVVVQARPQQDGDFTVDLSGLSRTSAEELRALVAQLVWTLADSEVRGPYRILSDGVPLSVQAGESAGDAEDRWTIDDVLDFDPRAVPDEPLRALRDGVLVEVADNGAVVSDGWTATGQLESVACAADGTVAAVVGHGDEQRRLAVGEVGGTPVTVRSADQISRPSWTSDGQMLYAVADGTRVKRWSKVASGGMTETAVDSRVIDELGFEEPSISELSVSRDGTRVALIINGRLYISVLETVGATGELSGPRLGTPVPVAPGLGDTAVSVGWRPDGTLLVGTRASAAPVWVVSVDGSIQNQLTSRNVTAPVVAVASTEATEYILDGRALLQLGHGPAGLGETDTADDFWREVPALQGARAVPVTVH